MKSPIPFRTAVANLLVAILEQARVLRLSQAAGSLAFLSMFAMVPMFSIAFAVLTALPVFGEIREALHRFLDGNLFPSAFSETLLSHVGQFAAQAGELSLVGAAAFFATAFTALLTVEATLNRIWGAPRPRPLSLRLMLYWAILTLGPLLLASSLALNGLLVTRWLRGGDLQELRSLWFIVLPWLTTFIGLALLYRVVPATHVRWREAFIGALLASVLIELLRRGIGIYVAQLPSYTIVYGAFAALPLFLFWLFLGWMALLAGALLAANLRWWRRLDDRKARRTVADRFDEARSVLDALAAELGGRTEAMLPVDRLRGLFDGDPRRAAETAGLLVSLDYLTRFASLPDSAPAVASQGAGRLAAWRRRRATRRGASLLDADDDDPVWSERWGWAAAPSELTLRRLFEAVWQPPAAEAGDTRRRFPADFLDAPLVAMPR
jgi:YihY family inner membrane protein